VAAVVEEGNDEFGEGVPVPLDSGLLHAGTTRPRVAAADARTAARNLHEGADFTRTPYQSRGRRCGIDAWMSAFAYCPDELNCDHVSRLRSARVQSVRG
jgi:hypothetical protein